MSFISILGIGALNYGKTPQNWGAFDWTFNTREIKKKQRSKNKINIKIIGSCFCCKDKNRYRKDIAKGGGTLRRELNENNIRFYILSYYRYTPIDPGLRLKIGLSYTITSRLLAFFASVWLLLSILLFLFCCWRWPSEHNLLTVFHIFVQSQIELDQSCPDVQQT